jgi:hypothetical protein
LYPQNWSYGRYIGSFKWQEKIEIEIKKIMIEKQSREMTSLLENTS